jgi:hypothetical protein
MSLKHWFGAAFLGLSLCVAGSAMAQAQPGGGAGQPGQGGGRQRGGNFDPTQARQQFLSRIKEQMGATDEEWSAISPKLEAVMNAQRDTRNRGGFGGGRTRGGNNADPNAQPQPQPGSDSAVAKAQADLRAVLDNKDAKPEEIKAKLTALRDAREKAKSSLAAAQKDLKDLLTQRQEAILVNMGFLD